MSKNKNKQGKEGLSEIVFILDESGSMSFQTNDTIGGFNEFIKTQMKMPGEAKFTFMKFSSSWGDNKSSHTIVHEGVDLADVKELNSETYVPSGGTALLDAVGTAINKVHKRIKNAKPENKPSNILFAILTDGEENSSSEFDSVKIKKMIEKRQKKNDWNFLFLGADIDAWGEGSKIGLGKMSASVDKSKMNSVFSQMSYYAGTTRSAEATVTMDTFNMSDEQIEKGLKDLENEAKK